MKITSFWHFILKKKRHDPWKDHNLKKPPFAHFSEQQKKTVSYLLKDYSGKK
jgi:hypothetical protein